jgi:adenylosuccinate synthase
MVSITDIVSGTTRKGIGPAYSTKAARSGIRMSEVFNKELFDHKLRALASGYKKRYGDLLDYDVEAEIKNFDVSRKRTLRNHLDDF